MHTRTANAMDQRAPLGVWRNAEPAERLIKDHQTTDLGVILLFNCIKKEKAELKTVKQKLANAELKLDNIDLDVESTTQRVNQLKARLGLL